MQLRVGDEDALGTAQDAILEINTLCNKILTQPDDVEDVFCSPSALRGRYLTIQKVTETLDGDGQWRLAEVDVYS